MTLNKQWKIALLFLGVFLAMYLLPFNDVRWQNGILESVHLAQWYAREHVLLCLIPAFFIAGAISVFVSQQSVLKYLGPNAKKPLAYGVASVSGTILAVCSCTVLPIFAGIYGMGAGLGPATAFLYSGPAINVLAIVLTANVLGAPLGTARAISAILFSVLIGILMHFLFRKEEQKKAAAMADMPVEEGGRPLWKTALYFFAMVGVLVFANWGKPGEASGFWAAVYDYKWIITSIFAFTLAVQLVLWFNIQIWKIAVATGSTVLAWLIFPAIPVIPFATGCVALTVILIYEEGEAHAWFTASWDFAKQILPLLFYGVLIAGALLGRPGHEGIIPAAWISDAVGGNSLFANFFSSFTGAFMYFATLTEIPILQGLLGSGMGQGPALALLLAGPALSLPNMLVIRSVLGTKKTVAFILLVIIISTCTGMLYGSIAG